MGAFVPYLLWLLTLFGLEILASQVVEVVMVCRLPVELVDVIDEVVVAIAIYGSAFPHAYEPILWLGIHVVGA